METRNRAYRIAAAGKNVALVDRGPVGGLCSLTGCNPKKVLVRATEVLEEVRHAGQHGIEAEVRRIDWSKVIDRKKSFTDLVPDLTEKALASAGVTLLRGTARFVSPEAIAVDAHLLGSGAAEFVHVFAMAVRFGLTDSDLERMV